MLAETCRKDKNESSFEILARPETAVRVYNVADWNYRLYYSVVAHPLTACFANHCRCTKWTGHDRRSILGLFDGHGALLVGSAHHCAVCRAHDHCRNIRTAMRYRRGRSWCICLSVARA